MESYALMFLIFWTNVIFCYGTLSNYHNATVDAHTQCDEGWYYSLDLNQCYYISSELSSFELAELRCNALSSHLVSVLSQEEYVVVSTQIQNQNFAGVKPAWIGLQTGGTTGFQWIDGYSGNYTHWINGTDNPGGACFAWFSTPANNGWWYQSCDQPLPFICKRHSYMNYINVTTNSGTITSPNYPLPYDADGNTIYFITVDPGYVIDLTFNFIAIDYYSLVNVYDGPNVTTPLLETYIRNYCAYEAEGELVSIYSKREYDIVAGLLQNQEDDTIPAWIGLQTYDCSPYYRWMDHSKVNFTHWVNGTAPVNTTADSCFAFYNDVANEGWFTENCDRDIKFVCKRHVAYDNDVNVNATTGGITSPSYPIPYEPGVITVYHISVPSGYVVDLTFRFLAIDNGSVIHVYDGPGTNASVLETINSTSSPNMIQSTSNQITVKFVAGDHGGGRYIGWSAKFQAIIPITVNGGLTSPNYPSNYIDNDSIVKYVHVPDSFGIIFTLWDFISEIDNDVLEITVGNSTLFHCSGVIDNLPYSNRTSSSVANITWTTNAAATDRGFNLTWVADLN